jgi:hypothetical protein
MNDNYWSWLNQQTDRNEAERAAFSEDSTMLSVMLLEPEIELEPPVPNGFESFWK